MDAIQGIEFGSEPDESLVPAFLLRVGLGLCRFCGVVPSRHPRELSGPLGTG